MKKLIWMPPARAVCAQLFSGFELWTQLHKPLIHLSSCLALHGSQFSIIVYLYLRNCKDMGSVNRSNVTQHHPDLLDFSKVLSHVSCFFSVFQFGELFWFFQSSSKWSAHSFSLSRTVRLGNLCGLAWEVWMRFKLLERVRQCRLWWRQ